MADKIAHVLTNAPSMLVITITTPDGKLVYDDYLMPKMFASGKAGYYNGGKGGAKLLVTRTKPDDDVGEDVYVTFQLNHQWVAVHSDKPIDDLR